MDLMNSIMPLMYSLNDGAKHMMHKFVEIAGCVVLVTCILTLAPTHHQPTIGLISIGIGTCLLLPTLMRG